MSSLHSWCLAAVVMMPAVAAAQGAPEKPLLVAPALRGQALAGPIAQQHDVRLRKSLGELPVALVGELAQGKALKAAKVSGACDDAPCGARLAKAAGARFVLDTSVTNADEIFEIKLSLYDAALGKQTQVAETCELCSVDEVDARLDKAVAGLKAAVTAEVPKPKPAEPAVVEIPVKLNLDPEGVTVFLDEESLGEVSELKVKPGAHVLLLRKVGYMESRREIQALDKPIELKVKLEKAAEVASAPIAPPLETVPPVPEVPEVSSGASSAAYTTAGWGMAVGGVALAGVGSWLIWLDGEVTCDDGRGRTECPTVYNTKGLGGIGLGVGAALLGAGVTTLILAPSDETPAATITPTPEGGALLELSGRF